jgi:hypothetical protein
VLYRPAFELLAGMPLTPFAEELVACAFAMSFNSSTGVPHDDFEFLVRFNRQDWSATRTAVLDAAECLHAEDTSNTGQWALVYLLRALSTTADADAETLLVELLTADRKKFKGWRLVEKYCSVDPCDPESVCPNDIGKTVEAYEQINVAEIHRHRSATSENHFLEEALPGMARFAPHTAVRVHRAVAASVVDRPSSELQLGMEGICIWTSASSPDIDKRRRQRLDSAASDYELDQEVLAALRQGHSGFLEAYAKTKLTSQQPAEIGRGLMVLGLGLESQFADETLEAFATTSGLMGKAAEAARFAYDRNRWSRHWFELMCATDSAEEFWRLSVLFLKVIDGRFGLWSGDIVRSGSAVSRFGFSINDRLRKRISAWKSKREKTLLGEKAPSEIYVVLN